MKSLLFLLPCVVLAACSTPQQRIADNPEVFRALSTEQQDKVRNGEIDIGFSPEAVLLAWGKPNRKREIRDAEQALESWIYLGYRTRHHHADFAYDDFFHHRHYCHYPLFSSGTTSEAYERARVDFHEDRVVAFEAEEK